MAKLINILLRKTDPDYPWGFTLGVQPPALHSIQITWVDKDSLASQHLEPGDRVLEIEGMDTTMLSDSEVESLLTNPSHKLELLIMKKSKPGVNVFSRDSNDDSSASSTKTVKTKETISSTTEEIQERKTLNEDLFQESKVITTEGKLHKQIMETTDEPANYHKTENTFWTRPPSDLIKQDNIKSNVTEGNIPSKILGGSYISESSIFKSLNNYRDEVRKMDPREEKRKFWESCRKEDSVRKFKWGDSVKLNRTSPCRSEGSTENLYRTETQPIPTSKERSKSCEPMVVPSNPFTSTNSAFPKTKSPTNVSPTNPFFNEFEAIRKKRYEMSSENSFSSNETNQTSHTASKSTKDSCITFSNDYTKYDYPKSRSNWQSTERIVNTNEDIEKLSEISKEYITKEENGISSFSNAAKKQTHYDISQREISESNEGICKAEFETKCKFFERATSVPISCVNKNAKDLVEDRLKEKNPPSSYGSAGEVNSTTSYVQDSHQITPNYSPDSDIIHHPLRKPSDFISQSLKTVTSPENTFNNPSSVHTYQGSIPVIEVSEYNSLNDECFASVSSSATSCSSFGNSSIHNLSPQENTFSKQSIPELSSCSKMNKNNVNGGLTYSRGGDQLNSKEVIYSNVPNLISGGDLGSANQFYGYKCADGINSNNIINDTSKKGAVSYNAGNAQLSDLNHTSGGNQVASSSSESIKHGWVSDHIQPNKQFNEASINHASNSEREFYEKRYFKESSFEKITRNSNSQFDNVQSSSTREYEEECLPHKKIDKRAQTPAGFYDNQREDIRSKSPPDICLKSFNHIRNRLGALLSATPVNVNSDRTKNESHRSNLDAVEEAFYKLTLQEGIIQTPLDNNASS